MDDRIEDEAKHGLRERYSSLNGEAQIELEVVGEWSRHCCASNVSTILQRAGGCSGMLGR